MTPKQQRFCEEYCIDFNGQKAAERAGYSKKTAREIASQLLTKIHIRAYVDEKRAQLAEKALVTAEYVIKGLIEVSERCMKPEAKMKWDYDSKAMVQVKDENGKDVWEFDSNGANKALELLGRHIGVFERDNNQKSGSIIVHVDD